MSRTRSLFVRSSSANCSSRRTLTIFDRRIELGAVEANRDPLAVDERAGRAARLERRIELRRADSSFPLAEKLSAPERDQLSRWLGAVTRVLQSAIGASRLLRTCRPGNGRADRPG